MQQCPLHNRLLRPHEYLLEIDIVVNVANFIILLWVINDNVLSYILTGVWGIEKQPLYKHSSKATLPDKTCFASIFMNWFLQIWINSDMTSLVPQNQLYYGIKMMNICFYCQFEQGSRSRSFGAWVLIPYSYIYTSVLHTAF